MNKILSYAKLSFELHVVSTFWLGSDTSGAFSLYFAPPSYVIERPALKTRRCTYFGAELTFVAAHFMWVFLMLDNPFPVPSLCKLSYISVCFIQISTKNANSLFPPEKTTFFWSDPRSFGLFGKFQDTLKIYIKTARVSRLSFSFLWLWSHQLKATRQLKLVS